MDETRATITRILLDAVDPSAAVEQVLPHVYAELRRIASNQLRKQHGGHSLQPTDLVHQVYLRLFDTAQLGWSHRSHFFASAALAMRRILIDHARRKQAQKRQTPESATPGMDGVTPSADMDILALDTALKELAQIAPRQAQIVELRYFGGLTKPEVAEVLTISESTVAREWRVAKLWLKREMGG